MKPPAWGVSYNYTAKQTLAIIALGHERQEVSPEFADAFRLAMLGWPASRPVKRKGVARKGSGAKASRKGRGRPRGKGRTRSSRGEAPSASERRTPDFKTAPPVSRVTTVRSITAAAYQPAHLGGSGETPPRKLRGKPCPKCNEVVGPRTQICHCGHNFYAGVSE
jgi:hypothetical protein